MDSDIKLQEYQITIRETRQVIIKVEASTYEEAIDRALDETADDSGLFWEVLDTAAY